MTTYLFVEDLLRLTQILGAGPVRDVGLLDSAAARPPSSPFGQDAYPSVPEKAAALLHSVAANHPLVDGNKRLAWLAAVVFLDLNGWDVGIDEDEAFDLVIDVASGAGDLPKLAQRLRPVQRG
ncbi:MAG: type II toxin-antitoxin system death-on-curing family toxin [Actinomycetia bacterium]|nr:type II toxin-antitoxin system death-on-curing family toxin [Actinomycetes bacterium]